MCAVKGSLHYQQNFSFKMILICVENSAVQNHILKKKEEKIVIIAVGSFFALSPKQKSKTPPHLPPKLKLTHYLLCAGAGQADISNYWCIILLIRDDFVVFSTLSTKISLSCTCTCRICTCMYMYIIIHWKWHGQCCWSVHLFYSLEGTLDQCRIWYFYVHVLVMEWNASINMEEKSLSHEQDKFLYNSTMTTIISGQNWNHKAFNT